MMNGRTNSGGTSTESIQIPLDAPSNVVAVAGVNSVSITWTDPKDKYGTTEGEIAQDPQQLVSVWSHSVVVRKIGSNPTDPLDGTVVCSSTTRNQYQSTGFVDMGLEINQTYYYGVFAYNESGVPSEGGFSNCHLWGFDSILENNTWEQIDQAGAIGLAPSLWEIGDEKDTAVSGETLTTVILDFNHDDASDGSGKVPMSFGLKELMANKRGWSQVYGGRWDGYLDSGIPDYLSNTVIPGLPESLQGFLKTVNKTYDKASTTKISIPTLKEVNGTGVMTNSSDRPTGGGYQYPYFATTQKRIKRLANGSGAVAEWYVASNHGGNTGYYPVAINEVGESRWATLGNCGICFCFYI